MITNGVERTLLSVIPVILEQRADVGRLVGRLALGCCTPLGGSGGLLLGPTLRLLGHEELERGSVM